MFTLRQIKEIDEMLKDEMDNNNTLGAKNLITSKAILLDKVIMACDKIGKLSKLFGAKKEAKAIFQPSVIDT
jgi:hypothetical protein